MRAVTKQEHMLHIFPGFDVTLSTELWRQIVDILKLSELFLNTCKETYHEGNDSILT